MGDAVNEIRTEMVRLQHQIEHGSDDPGVEHRLSVLEDQHWRELLPLATRRCYESRELYYFGEGFEWCTLRGGEVESLAVNPAQVVSRAWLIELQPTRVVLCDIIRPESFVGAFEALRSIYDESPEVTSVERVVESGLLRGVTALSLIGQDDECSARVVLEDDQFDRLTDLSVALRFQGPGVADAIASRPRRLERLSLGAWNDQGGAPTCQRDLRQPPG